MNIEQVKVGETRTLRRVAIARRVDALFKAMSTDFLLREQFVTDPAQVLSEYLEGARLPPQQASVSNHLLYSVMSNPGLRGWLRDYAMNHRGHLQSRNGFLTAFGKAVIDHGGHNVVLALMNNSVEKEGLFAFDEVFLYAVYGGVGLPPPDDPGTGGSEGAGPGGPRPVPPTTGTEMSTGTGTEMSTGTGTEMSTGTGTEMSTGTGTEVSTGTGSGFLGLGYVLVTLEALAEYATRLGQTGALGSALN